MRFTAIAKNAMKFSRYKVIILKWLKYNQNIVINILISRTSAEGNKFLITLYLYFLSKWDKEGETVFGSSAGCAIIKAMVCQRRNIQRI